MKRSFGFTLIEVLVALVVLAIAMTTLIVSTIETTSNSRYLQQKTEALWVADNVLNQLHSGILEFKAKNMSGKMNQAKNMYQWTTVVSNIGKPDLYRVEVRVGTQHQPSMVSLFTYMSLRE